MKTAALITLVITILGLGLAWWGAKGVIAGTSKVASGYEKIETGNNIRDQRGIGEGLHEIFLAQKNTFICQGILSLGLLIAIPSVIASLIFQIGSFVREPRKDPKTPQNPSVLSVS